jgi:putative SOS response-associated peptidase YedK
MCGRFTQSDTWSEQAERYRLTQPPRKLRSRYNIAPTMAIKWCDQKRIRHFCAGSPS